MEIRCVLFDFDCTLVNLGGFVDWERARRLTTQAYLKQGVPENLVRKHSRGGLFSLLNKTYDEFLRRLPADEAEKIQAAAFEALEMCEIEGVSNARPMPGCLEALHWLKERGIKIGIVSFNSGRVINQILNLHGLEAFIDAVVARDPRYRMKPHPDQHLLCARKLGCEPRNTMAVGDRGRDVVAAKRAGMFAVGVLTGFTSREELSAAGADEIIRDLHELPNVFSAQDPSL